MLSAHIRGLVYPLTHLKKALLQCSCDAPDTRMIGIYFIYRVVPHHEPEAPQVFHLQRDDCFVLLWFPFGRGKPVIQYEVKDFRGHAPVRIALFA